MRKIINKYDKLFSCIQNEEQSISYNDAIDICLDINEEINGSIENIYKKDDTVYMKTNKILPLSCDKIKSNFKVEK